MIGYSWLHESNQFSPVGSLHFIFIDCLPVLQKVRSPGLHCITLKSKRTYSSPNVSSESLINCIAFNRCCLTHTCIFTTVLGCQGLSGMLYIHWPALGYLLTPKTSRCYPNHMEIIWGENSLRNLNPLTKLFLLRKNPRF